MSPKAEKKAQGGQTGGQSQMVSTGGLGGGPSKSILQVLQGYAEDLLHSSDEKLMTPSKGPSYQHCKLRAPPGGQRCDQRATIPHPTGECSGVQYFA